MLAFASACLVRLQHLFPGEVTVLAGDGRQIPPVVPGGGQSDIYIYMCHLHYGQFILSPQRLKVRDVAKKIINREDPSFSSMVDRIIGHGVLRPDPDRLVNIPGVLYRAYLRIFPCLRPPPHSCLRIPLLVQSTVLLLVLLLCTTTTLILLTISSSVGLLANCTLSKAGRC